MTEFDTVSAEEQNQVEGGNVPLYQAYTQFVLKGLVNGAIRTALRVGEAVGGALGKLFP